MRFFEGGGDHPIDVRAFVISLLPAGAPDVPAPRSGYLPETGAIPLRFGERSVWPAPFAKPEQASSTAAVEIAASLHSAGVGDAPASQTAASTNGLAPVDAVAQVTATAALSQAASPKKLQPGGQILLSAEFVLGQLPQLSAEMGAIPARFLPAVPTNPVETTGPLAALQ